MAIHILMQSIEDDNRTSIYTLTDTDEVPAILQLEVAKKAGWIPALDKQGKIKRVVAAFESNGGPQGFRRMAAYLKP